MQRRRRRWKILALMLLPAVIGITALSAIHLGAESPAPAAPAATPTHSSPADIETLAPFEAIPPAPEPLPATTPGPAPTINATQPEMNEAEDPEHRPLIPAVMLADNQPTPTFALDAAADSSTPSGSGVRYTLGRSFGGGSFGGGSAGGGSGGGGSGSGSGPETTETSGNDQNRIESFPTNSDTGGGVQSEPTLPGPNGSDKTIPSGPPTMSPEDLITPIDGGGGGVGGGSGEEPNPHVSVPEPSTWGLFGIGLLGAALMRRKRRSDAA